MVISGKKWAIDHQRARTDNEMLDVLVSFCKQSRRRVANSAAPKEFEASGVGFSTRSGAKAMR
jgi:hypothetical protein